MRHALLWLSLLLVALFSGCADQYAAAPAHVTFPLLGRHADAPCAGCHPDGFSPPPDTACAACHTATPPHDPGGCEGCHTVTTWAKVVWPEHAFLPLERSHDLPCATCHTEATYAGLDATCANCHTAEPGHFDGQDCAGCHPVTTWKDGVFGHVFLPLTGVHDQPCATCHTGPGYEGLDAACATCHAPPDAAHFPGAACETCHAATAWQDGVFDHLGLPLVGLHDVRCDQCHTGPDYHGLDAACVSCHEADRPFAAHFAGERCDACHDVVQDWAGGRYDHLVAAGFALQSAHAVGCEVCHATDTYAGLDPACVTCHDPDRPFFAHFDGRDCAGCHEVAPDWTGGAFGHLLETGFALDQAHAVACAACHPGDTYAGEDPACVACHAGDRPVDHFGTRDCAGCHPVTAWGDGVFDHTGTLPACSSCHAGDAPANHPASYPGECDLCHRTTAWLPTIHPEFPIPHRGVSSCVACHVIPQQWSTFECITCHEHNQADSRDHHREVNGYTWVSTECYRCHPNGRH